VDWFCEHLFCIIASLYSHAVSLNLYLFVRALCGHMINVMFLPHTYLHMFIYFSQIPEVKIETSSFCLHRFSFLRFLSISMAITYETSFSRVGGNPSVTRGAEVWGRAQTGQPSSPAYLHRHRHPPLQLSLILLSFTLLPPHLAAVSTDPTVGPAASDPL
jgi:hypothetical protein